MYRQETAKRMWVVTRAAAEDWQKSWMGREVWSGANYDGTLLNYVGGQDHARKLYRCPALAPAPLHSGLGSNGWFDYTSFLSLAGARTSAVPISGAYLDIGSSQYVQAQTPVVVEEDPAYWVNHFNIEPGHSNIDRIGTWHVDGGGNCTVPDGSAQHIQPTTLGPSSWEWRVVAPSGQVTNLQHHGTGFGEWNRR